MSHIDQHPLLFAKPPDHYLCFINLTAWQVADLKSALSRAALNAMSLASAPHSKSMKRMSELKVTAGISSMQMK